MIIELIILIIFACSLAGILFVLAFKIPALNSLPHNEDAGIRKNRIVLNVENKVKDILVSFEKQIFFHKFLSWLKVMTLRTETKVDHLLHGIRRKAQKVDKKISDKKNNLPS